MFKESVQKGKPSATLTQEVIALTPKPNKLHIENWRPVSLVNNDDKLFVLIFVLRLLQGFNETIDEEQCGFMQKRSDSDIIHLIIDVIDNNLIPAEDFILFTDFYKTFEMIEHDVIFKAIPFFGFE